jgi:hypothetical protein
VVCGGKRATLPKIRVSRKNFKEIKWMTYLKSPAAVVKQWAKSSVLTTAVQMIPMFLTEMDGIAQSAMQWKKRLAGKHLWK